MTPGARVAAAIEILDRWLEGRARLEPLLRSWGRENRYAGSKDRRAIGDLVYEGARRRRSLAARSGASGGRAIMHGLCLEEGRDPASLFTGERHHPAPLNAAEAAPQPAPTVDAEIWDHPDWMTRRLRDALGDRYEEAMAILNRRAPLDLRANVARAAPEDAAARLAEQGIETTRVGGVSTALRAAPGARVAGAAAFRDGLVELQDAASQLASDSVDRGGDILDFCAGAGGKSLAIAAKFGEGARVIAHDAEPSRMADLPQRAARAGAQVELASTAALAGRTFDVVFVDAPCSGSGTWRRDVDAKWRLDEDRLLGLASTQENVLRAAEVHARPGGRLIYATCSLFRCENEDRARAFEASSERARLRSERRCFPGEPGDGFYFAIFDLS